MSGEGLHEAPTSHMYRKRSSASHTCHQTRPGLNGVIGRLRNILLRIPANCLSPRMHVATFRPTFTHFLCINISGKTCVHIMCIDIILRTKSGKTKNEAIPIQSYSWVRVPCIYGDINRATFDDWLPGRFMALGSQYSSYIIHIHMYIYIYIYIHIWSNQPAIVDIVLTLIYIHIAYAQNALEWYTLHTQDIRRNYTNFPSTTHRPFRPPGDLIS